MGYLSEATGTMEMAANSLGALKELKECFEATRYWWHDITCIDLEGKKINEYPGAMKVGYLRYHITCKFKGTGDRFFPATLGAFQEWLNKEILPNNQLLQDSDFHITFKYIDQSSEQNFINEMYGTLTHTSGEIVVKSQNAYKSIHEYTLVNRAKCTGNPLNKIIFNDFEYKDFPYIISTLHKEKEEIEKYTGKLLEIYLYENGLGNYAELYNKFITS